MIDAWRRPANERISACDSSFGLRHSFRHSSLDIRHSPKMTAETPEDELLDPADAPRRHAPGEYVVVARRYRPQAFAELIGQEHVGRGLIGAIQSHRVGHAYLFPGARGVGKT